MNIKFPILILGYSPSKIFSTENGAGRIYLPVFDDPEKAEAYRIFFSKEFGQLLEAYVVADLNQAIPLFNLLLTVDPGLGDVVIDPPPPVNGKDGGQVTNFHEFLGHLERKHRMRSNRRHRRRRGDKYRPTHTN